MLNFLILCHFTHLFFKFKKFDYSVILMTRPLQNKELFQFKVLAKSSIWNIFSLQSIQSLAKYIFFPFQILFLSQPVINNLLTNSFHLIKWHDLKLFFILFVKSLKNQSGLKTLFGGQEKKSVLAKHKKHGMAKKWMKNGGENLVKMLTRWKIKSQNSTIFQLEKKASFFDNKLDFKLKIWSLNDNLLT